MKKILFFITLVAVTLSSCIQDDFIDDFVEPTIRITTLPDTILVGAQFQFEFTYLNNVGQSEDVTPVWTSADESLLTIDQNGLATALEEGSTEISVSYTSGDIDVSESFIVNIGQVFVESTIIRTGVIETTTFYTLEGDFTITETDTGILISIAENYAASSTLPGLVLYLTNNPSTTSGAFEVGAVNIFSGAHEYEVEGVDINEHSHLLYFCAPFNVKVGDGLIN